MEDDDDQRKIDLKQHALPPVSKTFLLRIVMYVLLLAGLCYVVFYLYNRKPEPKPVKSPKDVKEIRGVILDDTV